MMRKEFVHLDNQIKEFLTSFYQTKNFLAQPDYTGFYVAKDDFSQKIILGPTAEYSSRIIYEPVFKIANFELQEVKEKILGSESRFKNYTVVASQGEKLAQDYGVSGYEGWTMYDVKGEGDIQPMIEHHKEFMEKAGWQFLEQTQTIEGIHKYLNDPFIDFDADSLSQEEKTRLVRHNGADWMVNGLVAAWLVKDKNFKQLVDKYRTIYFPDHIQQTMDTLLKSLDY